MQGTSALKKKDSMACLSVHDNMVRGEDKCFLF